MHKYRFLMLAFLLFSLAGLRKAVGQTYTTTGISTDWNNPTAWTRNDTGCTVNNGGPPPPRTLNPGNACPVKIIINHPITYAGTTSMGGGYMDSLIINTGGNLIFTGNLTVNNVGNSVGAFSFTVRGGGILNVNGNFTNQNGASIRVQSAGAFNIGGNYNTTGSSSSLSIDATSSLSVIGSTTINSNHILNVSGLYTTNTLSTGSGGNITFNSTSNISVLGAITHSNGSITMSNTANLIVGGNFDMSGSAALNVSGDSDIKVSGNLNFVNGVINNAGNGDIRIEGNLSMSGGSNYNGSNNSYIQVSGDHNVSANNPVNLSNDAKFYTEGDRTGNYWAGPTLAGNSCYRAANNPFNNSTCLPCITDYSIAGTFYVPAGIAQLTIEMVGGGGKGGNRSTSNGVGGGGGGGAYSRIIVDVSPGEPLGVFVGAGGNQTNPNGGVTYVTRNPSLPVETGSILFASGGAEGSSDGLGLSNGGGPDTRPNRISYSGGNGAASSGSNSGGGGSAASTNNAGNNGGTPNAGQDPSGIGGPGGAGRNNDGNGNSPISGFGGGGGGARRNGSNNRLGGNGSNGYVVISYTCPANSPCSKYLDFGTVNGYSVIEYFCSGVWNAPEGLEAFSITSIGGGGGGGFGSSAGGGGGGAIVSQTFSNINQRPANPPSLPIALTYGLPPNTNFNVTVGDGSLGATSSARSVNGQSSGITGTFTNYANASVTLSSSALGGGGGGSSNIASFRNGLSGGSGGGGGMIITPEQPGLGGGIGTGTSFPGGNGARGTQGNSGRYYGAGGGGAGGAGTTNEGNNNAGRGGNGIQLSSIPALSGISSFFAAGGGGTMVGPGGSANSGGSSIGGAGNDSGTGGAGMINTGSGGGAGSPGGGKGGSGRVYIYYQNFRILPVEYLYFNATYQPSERSGELNWATAKEWESSHFEIERAVNDVKTWTKVGEVEGAGYSDVPVEYSFTDSNLPASGGNIFYRLKQADLNGDVGYSVTKSIQVEALDGSTSWIVYPNPSAMGSTVSVDLLDKSGFTDSSIQIRISDARGISAIYSVSNSEEVTAVVNSYLSQARPGLHILQLFWGDRFEVIKLIRR